MQRMINLAEIYLLAVGRVELIKIFNCHLRKNLYLRIYNMVKVNYNFLWKNPMTSRKLLKHDYLEIFKKQKAKFFVYCYHNVDRIKILQG